MISFDLAETARQSNETLTKHELDAIIESIHSHYGYDFIHYNRSTLGRRIKWTMVQQQIASPDDFRQRIIVEPALFGLLLENLSINVTAMFRDPMAYRYLREQIFPILATYPHIRIWCAGVATGEEAYSIAILLREANLYQRSLIYATDFNPVVLKQAFKGNIPLDKMAQYTQNYIESGGKTAFSKYYQTSASMAHLDPELRENIVFSTHNLISDGVFNEFHLILCRNVLIYFDEHLTDKVIHLFRESLAMRCFLFLGEKEQLQHALAGRYFERMSQYVGIYRKLE